ncbi:iron ABC transporter substrate-binding protein [Plantactinospora mayteni]|uniref:Iron ABC transporter substrate-binding protein n=1 Tax=Plantactinospora mayteni TaxID=566021 RepID=A0ABQ4F211_9ACTN|nr:iron ABC transporter substrate-binding protein [Plantactinospora mayteni]GIH00956.1 iron ABC transporter substrate-binding protein [Plantactinospora mayteni]
MRGARALAGIAAITLLATTGCSTSEPTTEAGTDPSDVTLTLYNAQHVDLAEAMVKDFTAQTGIKVQLRNGKDFELANQIVAEGAASPADVFITENSPAMSLVAAKSGFATVDPDTQRQVPARFTPPDKSWVGFAARQTVFVYNPSLLPAAQLPTSLLDLAKPEWKGRYGIAAAGADFQAIVSAVLALQGPEQTSAWLTGLKTNAKIYPGNGAILKAVNAGEIPAGVIYHYYWYKDRAESGANSSKTELHLFDAKDPGAFLSVSGAGVLKSSKHPKEAQQLVAYLTGAKGQQILSDSTALEYSIASDVPANAKLKPLSELSPPDVDLSRLNGPEVIALMQKAGLL